MMREYVWLRACLHDALPEVIREMIVAHAMDVRGKGACQKYLLERQIAEEVQDLADAWARSGPRTPVERAVELIAGPEGAA